jgi:hypothetical protein
MTPVKLMIITAALAVIANARVAVLPGWVVPVPVVFLAVVLAVTGALAALLVLRLRIARAPLPAPAGPRVVAGEVAR